MSLELTGKIDNILQPVTRGNFTSRKLWLTTEEQYPQTIEIECGGNKSSLFDNLTIGQQVKISINIRGRKWEDKCFNTLSAWKVESPGATIAQSSGAFTQHEPQQTTGSFINYTTPSGTSDNIPF